jgi:tRNA(His) guanylyltransferase
MKINKILRNKEILNKFKIYEKRSETILENNRPFIIRLDGNNFSRFTKNFIKPFDVNLHNILVESSKILHLKFSPGLVFYNY